MFKSTDPRAARAAARATKRSLEESKGSDNDPVEIIDPPRKINRTETQKASTATSSATFFNKPLPDSPISGGSSSQSGDMSTEAKRTPEIASFFRYDPYDPKEKRIVIHLNAGQRPKTYLPDGSQGDHVVSYYIIIEAVISSIFSLSIEESEGSLKEIIREILPKKRVSEEYLTKEIDVHEYGFRDRVTKAMRIGGAELSDIELANKELKDYKRMRFGSRLVELSNYFLSNLQTDSSTTFYSSGREKSKSEGAEVKSAARALMALQILHKLLVLDLRNFTEEKIESLKFDIAKRVFGETEDEHLLRYGINVFEKEINGKNKDKFANSLLTALNKVEANNAESVAVLQETINTLLQQFLERPDVIAKFIGNLFDYEHVLEFNLEEDDERHIRKIQEYFPKASEELGRHSYQQVGTVYSVTRESIEKLAEQLIKYKHVILAAFPVFKTYEENFNQIWDAFLGNEILINQKWNLLPKLSTHEGLEVLKTAIKNVSSSTVAETSSLPTTPPRLS